MNRVLTGDVLTWLRTIPTGSFDAALSDPPYGLGFLGLGWDKVLPSGEVWVELVRVLKPGSNALIFGGARTFHRLAVSLEDAGFYVADVLTWLYGQGMPKSRSLLKPAWEPIVLVRSPGKKAALLNIDGCRIPNEDGRFPANVLIDEETRTLLDAQSGQLKSGSLDSSAVRKNSHSYSGSWNKSSKMSKQDVAASSGGASRFYYCAKVRKDRVHPTQKPVELTEWLAKLLLVPGGRLIVPYSGVGSEMLGAKRAGWVDVLGIEHNEDYVQQAQHRMADGNPGDLDAWLDIEED